MRFVPGYRLADIETEAALDHEAVRLRVWIRIRVYRDIPSSRKRDKLRRFERFIGRNPSHKKD
jgi:hypothetical protein